ncbi:hypothetical protein GFY24_22090 [Nocardia sp. SYP-A9097]|uniref:hypothetical protein n=1 Tax=Nocardia sp. SYP-A9097 TaxID=2663237 RepID=UPI00129AD8E4|nr:hypothetical protein [Nocardia sp. SYP-A9097]MRH90099.1 hypothetical protein [Nocardia sp. SYP-A9097]
MSDPTAFFDLHTELSDELIAALALVLFDSAPDAAAAPPRVSGTRAHTVFRNPRGWR